MRPRKPTELHELNGSYDKNPQRRRPVAPKSNHPIGDAPNWLNEIETDIWHRIVFDIPEGVLTQPDKYVLALLCQLQAKAQTNKLNGVERGQLIGLYGRLGMSPSDRSRISPAPAGQKDDEFTEFA